MGAINSTRPGTLPALSWLLVFINEINYDVNRSRQSHPAPRGNITSPAPPPRPDPARRATASSWL